MAKKDASEIKACAILSYILVGIIWFFVDNGMRKNKLCKFHAQQGAVFLIFYVVWGIAVSIVLGLLRGLFALASYSGVSLFFGTILGLVGLVAWAIPLILLIIGMVNAANGKNKELPVIGKYGKKFKF